MGSVPGVNQGVPATPRDGAPIEIIGLIASALRFACELSGKGLFENHVTLKDGSKLLFGDWYSSLISHFENCFYIPDQSEQLA